MKKCLVIGAAMLDIIMQIDRLPLTGEDIYAKRQDMAVGGCAYNVADIIAHFGGKFTLFAPIGSGMYADYIEKILAAHNQKSFIKSTKMDNGYCLCMVEQGGERTFLTLPGIECNFEKNWFAGLNMEEYESVYVSGYEIEGNGGSTILDFLEAHKNLTIYYAPGPRIPYIKKDKAQRMNRLAPVIHLNEKESLLLTNAQTVEDAAYIIQEDTQNTVIITLGENGAYVREKDQGNFIPSVSSVVVDTIGAGDSHIGAVIGVRQLGYSFSEAIKLANQVSAIVVGTQGPSISREQLQHILPSIKRATIKY